jgi:hypothetical protein
MVIGCENAYCVTNSGETTLKSNADFGSPDFAHTDTLQNHGDAIVWFTSSVSGWIEFGAILTTDFARTFTYHFTCSRRSLETRFNPY